MKLVHAGILTLIAATSVAAQQPAGPVTEPVTTVLRTRTMGLQRNLAQAFDSIPEAKFGYKPTPAQLTVGHIAQHLANDNYLFCNNFGAMKGTRAPEDTETADSLKAKWPKEKLVAKLKESFTFCETAFQQLNDAALAQEYDAPGPNGTTRKVVRAGSVVGHVIDMADHYSQIANYMRLNNILPPTALPRPGRGGDR
jgi:hypothetical protein